MARFIKKQSRKIGLPPGSLIHVGEKRTEKTTISLIDFDEEQINETTVESIEDVYPYKDKSTTSWINITGIEDTAIIEKIGKHFSIHPLVLEDIIHTDQRPKYEDFDTYLFIILNMLRYEDRTQRIITEQISFILTDTCVLSFQEIPGDVFHPIRERIRNAKGRIRGMGPDYLMYTLIDAIVDHYYLILEKIGDRIEGLENEVVQDPTPETLQIIYHLKQEIIYLRRSVWPLREVINSFQKQESLLIHESTDVFLRDVYDHTIQIMDTVETFRDMISGLLDIYMSSVSNKMNEVMKVLTIFAAIFIPLTFIAGVYGMNFEHMPELIIPWAYPLVLAVMFTVAISLLIYFKRKNWI